MKCILTGKNNQHLHNTINDKPIEEVSKFISVDHMLWCKNGGTGDIHHRIGLEWTVYEKNTQLFASILRYYRPSKLRAIIFAYFLLFFMKLSHSIGTELYARKFWPFKIRSWALITNHRFWDQIKTEAFHEITKLTFTSI